MKNKEPFEKLLKEEKALIFPPDEDMKINIDESNYTIAGTTEK
jgi:hypothetical protein